MEILVNEIFDFENRKRNLLNNSVKLNRGIAKEIINVMDIWNWLGRHIVLHVGIIDYRYMPGTCFPHEFSSNVSTLNDNYLIDAAARYLS